MSPIDDELRAALHGRAQVLSPSPDSLAGIERRAKRIQRNRIGAAVAGSVLAVSAIAVAVPAIQSATSTGPNVPPVAASPSAEPTLTVSPYALSPAQPWTYRGTPQDQLGTGTIDTFEREYAVKRGVDEAELTLTPLWGQIWEPSGLAEVVFLAEADGSYRWGVAQAGEAGPEFPVDEPLPSPALALAAALPGDEGVERLLVVAAPSMGGGMYAADGSDFRPMTDLEPGVFISPMAPGDGDDRYMVLDGDGDLDNPAFEGPAPDFQNAG